MNNISLSNIDPDSVMDAMSNLESGLNTNAVLVMTQAVNGTVSVLNQTMVVESDTVEFYDSLEATITEDNNQILSNTIGTSSTPSVQAQENFNLYSQEASAATETSSTAVTRENNQLSTTASTESNSITAASGILDTLSIVLSLLASAF